MRQYMGNIISFAIASVNTKFAEIGRLRVIWIGWWVNIESDFGKSWKRIKQIMIIQIYVNLFNACFKMILNVYGTF